MASQIMIIRHGEKDTDFEDNHLLSRKGHERAEALIGYFTKREEIVNLLQSYPLAGIFAQDVDHHGAGKSKRPIQTVQPLSSYIAKREKETSTITSSASVIQKYRKKDTQKMIDRLLSDEFKGKTVLISWNHNGMVPLAKAFGATCVPEKWKGKRFDITWVIGEDKRLIQLPQLLLHGDEDTIMKVEDSACSHI